MRSSVLSVLVAVALAGCGAPETTTTAATRTGNDLVSLSYMKATAAGPESVVVMVPQSYINSMMQGTAAAGGVGSIQQGLVAQDTWTAANTPPCNNNDLWIADSGWAHYGCINYDGVSSTGTCGGLTSMLRYISSGTRHYWGRAIYYFRPGPSGGSAWNGCFLTSVDCSTGVVGNFSVGLSGSITDPNGSASTWSDATTWGANPATADSVYAGSCPGGAF